MKAKSTSPLMRTPKPPVSKPSTPPPATPSPMAEFDRVVEQVKAMEAGIFRAPPPEPKYTTVTKVFTTTDPLHLVSKIPKTKTEIVQMVEDIKNDGLVLRSDDGLKVTTYMPSSIMKVVVELTLAEETPVEDKLSQG